MSDRVDLDALETTLALSETPMPWHVGENDGPTLASMYRGHLENHHARIDGERDAAAIVALVNAAPALIARVRELEAVIRRILDTEHGSGAEHDAMCDARALLPKETP